MQTHATGALKAPTTAPDAAHKARACAPGSDSLAEQGDGPVDGFALLLQAMMPNGVEVEPIAAEPIAAEPIAAAPIAAEPVAVESLAPQTALQSDPALVSVGFATQSLPSPVPAAGNLVVPANGEALSLQDGDGAWSIDSLLGQTAKLDNAVETSLRDSTHFQRRLEAAGGLGALATRTAAVLADNVAPVVAQGVAALGMGAMTSPALQQIASAAGSVVASWVAEPVVAAVSESISAVVGDEPLVGGNDRATEGRTTLEGQWVSTEKAPQLAENMQRLLGQMSQFLAATGATDMAGLRRSGAKSAKEEITYDSAELAASALVGQATGRLTEQAVEQTAASANTQHGTAQEAAPDTDLTYWMNGRQQRAEMVLERDGESVRVQVMLEGNEAHVTFRSDADSTRAMLDDTVAQLRDMLQAQGLHLAGVQVRAQTDTGAQDRGQSQSDFMPSQAQRIRLRGEAAEALQLDNMPEGVRGHAPQRPRLDVFA